MTMTGVPTHDNGIVVQVLGDGSEVRMWYLADWGRVDATTDRVVRARIVPPGVV